MLSHTQTNTHTLSYTTVLFTSVLYIHPEQTRPHSSVKLCLPLNRKNKNITHPNTSLLPATHRQTKQRRMRLIDCRHLNPTRRPVCVCICVCVCVLQESKALYLAPMKTPAAEAVKPSTRYLVFKSFLTSLSARARPFMPLPLLSVIKANLNPLIISPQKTISPAPLEWLWGHDGCVPCKVIFCPF